MQVLIVRMTSLGDVIHTLPALCDATKQIDNIEFDWLVEESFQGIPKWHKNVNKIIPVATRRWRKKTWASLNEIKSFYQNLREKKYDVVIDSQGLLKSAFIARIAKSQRLVGYDKSSIKENFAANFYKENISITENIHAVLKVRELFAKTLGYDYSTMTLDYGIRDYFKTSELNENKTDVHPYIFFLHGTTWASKHWPIKYWQELGMLLNNQGFAIYLSWGNEIEKQNAKEIASKINNAKILPKRSIEAVAGTLTKAKLVIAVDTGLGHLTAALSVPCISIYGATDANKTGAMGNKQVHLSGSYPCAPCLKKTCKFNSADYQDYPPCYQVNDAQSVYKKSMEILNNNHELIKK